MALWFMNQKTCLLAAFALQGVKPNIDTGGEFTLPRTEEPWHGAPGFSQGGVSSIQDAILNGLLRRRCAANQVIAP